VAQIDEFKKSDSEPGLISVQCFPLYSILLALNRTTVDFFSLDVEGFELEVLRTIPWDKVDINTADGNS
jgi:FkbM family methyltransferase